MLDLIKALLILRLAVTATGVRAALVLLAVWSLSNGAESVGIAVLAALPVCLALVPVAFRWGVREH